MIGAASEEDIPLLRRYYSPFEHLLNPETGGWAEYWDFWDLAFEPREDGEHRFFGSRDQAMQSEFLQPIEQIDRVLAYDTFTRFDDVEGLRPELSLCRECH